MHPATIRTTDGANIRPSVKWLNSSTSANIKAPANINPIPEICKRKHLFWPS